MQYVNLGKTGLKVSRICLGMMTYGTSQWRDWVLDEDDSRPFIKRALELGINFFDTADMYSLGVSEEVTGRALRDFARRDEVIIASKVFNPMSDDPNARGLSRKHIMDGIDATLRRLGTDYVDLYQIHRWDYNTPHRRDDGSAARCRQGQVKRVISARRVCSRGSLPKPNTPPICTAGRALSRCRIITIWSTAKKSAR